MPYSFKNIDVLILCGGLGKRLRKITRNSIPKAMIRFGDGPFLDIIINYMAGFGFRRFILGVGYKADAITDYYRNAKRSALDVYFSHEKRPLGTGGAVKNAQRLIKSDYFFVLNGDSFCRFNPLSFFSSHKQKKALVSILLTKIGSGREYGEVKADKNLRILKFNEKNRQAKKCLVNAGVYIFSKKAFYLMPSQARFSLERDFFPKMLKKGVFGYLSSAYFIDIGTPKRYLMAKKRFL